MQAPDPGTVLVSKRALPSVRLSEEHADIRLEEEDFIWEKRPPWRKDRITHEASEVQETSAAALAEAKAKSSVDPLGSLFEGMPGAGTSTDPVGAATEARVTPQGAVRNELFDTRIILREMHT